MRDLEGELRETLNRKADEASTLPIATPAQIRDRVHRRQARTLMLSAAVAVSILGSLVGIRALGPDTVRPSLEPASQPFTVHEPPLSIGDRQFLLASGDSAGEAWSLVAFEDANGLGLEIRAREGAAGLGNFTVPKERAIEVRTQFFGTAPNLEEVIFGAAAAEATGVRFEFTEGGTTIGRLIQSPSSLHEGLKIVLIQLRQGSGGHIILTDSGGREIAREPYGPAPFEEHAVPPPPPRPATFSPGELVGNLDHYGNTVGYVPAETLFAPPPPPGTEAPAAAWAPPGLHLKIDEIRAVALVPLTHVWPELADWWHGRPEGSAPDAAFRDWWAAYPVHEARTQTGLAEELFDARDVYDNVWGYVPLGKTGPEIRSTRPGEQVDVGGIRSVAGTPVSELWSQVTGWWARRPTPQSSNAEFLNWWASYPVEEKLQVP